MNFEFDIMMCKIYIENINKYNIMSPYCINCGKEVEESWNSCPNCGKVLKGPHVVQEQPILRQPLQPQPPQYQTPQYQRKYGSGGSSNFGIAALICGLIGPFFAFFIIEAFFVGIVFSLITIILGGIGIGRDDNNILAIIGLVIGIADFVCCLIFYFLIFSFFSWFWMWW